MKYCSKCGNKLKDKDVYCSNCGAKVEEVPEAKVINNFGVEKRDVAVQIILTLVTCGIYGLYWVMTITDDINTLNDDNNLSGGTTVLLFILTCGLYSIFWGYDMSKKLYNIGEKYNVNIQDNSVLCLLLSICKLNFVNCFLLQSDLNKFEN